MYYVYRAFPRFTAKGSLVFGTAAQPHAEQMADHRAVVALGMIVFLTFLLIPIAQSSYYSLFKWNGFGPPTNYRGPDNYVDLLERWRVPSLHRQ